MNVLEEIVRNFSQCKVAVFGDLILDRYTWGSSSRISPEAPVPVVDVDEESQKLGGAGNAAQTMSALDADVTVFARIGSDDAGQTLNNLLQENSLELFELPNSQNRPTTVKTRVIAEGQHLLRIDEEDRTCVSQDEINDIDNELREALQSFDALLLSDYGKGVLSEETLPSLLTLFQDFNLPVIVDPYSDHFPLYRDVSLITPNETELREGMGDPGPEKTALTKLARRLFQEQSVSSLLVTQGDRGMTLYESNRNPYQIETEAREVYDVTGAGDTVSGIVSLGEALDEDRQKIIQLANLAAGIVVARMGTTAVTSSELLERIDDEPV